MAKTAPTVSQGRRRHDEKRATRNEYCVQPILVNGLASQCAAHFLVWFQTNSEDHIREVLKSGPRGPGGLLEEIEHWFQECSDDAADPVNGPGVWESAENGPWVYEAEVIPYVQQAVREHTKGWKARDFGNYGVLTSAKAALEEAVAKYR